MSALFTPIEIGRHTLPNRLVMAPMTRSRADESGVPGDLVATYYAQRAGAGLIISEASPISKQGAGWPFSPGFWTDEQVAAWQPATRAVHEAGGRIVAQLWHMGRLVHPSLSGEQPVSASAVTAPGQAHTYDGKQDYAEPRPLRLDEIPGLIADYVHAAKNAIRAGFDGIQIHAANGYLIDQFLRDGTNKREDAYGGSIENRARLLIEVTQAIADAIGPERTAVRLSPNGETQGVIDSNPEPLFAHVARELDKIGISFLEVRDVAPWSTFGKTDQPIVSPAIRANFSGVLILNGDYTAERAETALAEGRADAIAFGRPFIANPDLPARIAAGASLAEAEMATWYSQGDEGYIDYPALDTAQAA